MPDILPVGIGLAAGIAMIIVFSLFSPSSTNQLANNQEQVSTGIPVNETQNHLVAIAMNVSGIKAWSPVGWRWLGTDMLYGPNGEAHGIVQLMLPPAFPTPKNCTEGWYARVEIDIQTLQVVSSDYPAIGHDDCGGLSFGGPVQFSKWPNLGSIYGSQG